LEAIAQTKDEFPLKGIVHLWSLETDVWELATTQELTCRSILNLLQATPALLKLPPLWLVTQGVMGTGDEGTSLVSNAAETPGDRTTNMQPQQALLWGLGKVITMEYPGLDCRCLDLDPNASEEETLKVLVEEVVRHPVSKGNVSTNTENQIRYRQGARQVARLTQAKLETDTKLVLENQSSYLITGGLGGVGWEIAKFLVQQGARNLVLIGRNAPSETATESIQQLEKAGANVSVLLGDVSKEKDMVDIFQHIQTSLPPLKGVIHAAGVIDDGLLQQMSWQQFTKVTAPKVEGTWNLHKLTKDIPLDFFVCFSSITSVLGNPGQGNYAAANAFMDGITQYRRHLGLPGLSINWGGWANVGMAARMEAQQQSRLQSQGFQSIQPEQGLQAFEEVLAGNQAQIAVFPVDWPQFLTQFGSMTPALLSDLASQFDLQAQTNHGPKLREFLEELKRTTQEQRQRLIIDYLVSTVAKILRRSKTDLPDPEEGFFNLGMDSLMAVDLSRRIQADLGISLSSTSTFEYPNIQSLADYLEELIPSSYDPQAESETPEVTINSEDILSGISQLSENEMEQALDEALSELDLLL
ncbi:MAG: SDR family NAD(P)-dependent oxidoreductase, partial [Moorea sp. SIO3G5]|nr:SDR family NAD(P)-dependent oxidoreductase [Moorena sp. SIO3G5]